MKHIKPHTLRLPARAQGEGDFGGGDGGSFDWATFWNNYFTVLDIAIASIRAIAPKIA
ncbi:MAG: hypothetical protein KJ052_02365 [Candidatus Hydrogenedentes bacterium]|nr:hypothetical protein [Candidatus Hydrogenedentota bacterium]